jgi:hypothetical protein
MKDEGIDIYVFLPFSEIEIYTFHDLLLSFYRIKNPVRISISLRHFYKTDLSIIHVYHSEYYSILAVRDGLSMHMSSTALRI